MFCALHEAKDVYDTLLPVFILSKILGLAPFKFDTSSRRFIPHCGAMVTIRIIIVLGIMGYVSVLVYDPNATITIAWVALRCELYCGTTVTCIVLSLAITNQKLIIQAVENITKIDHHMMKIGINITYKNAQIFSYLQIGGITMVFLSKLVLQAFSAKEYYIFVYNVFNVVDYINTIMLFQYTNLLLLLRQRYIWINRQLRKFKVPTIPQEFNVNNLKLTQAFTNFENIDCISASNLIVSLGKIHMQLFDTAKLVNRAYGVQLLSSICARFIMITTQLINTYNTIQDPHIGDANTYALIAIYLFLHSSKIFMIASISENTAAKARDTAIYLHKLWDVGNVLKDKVIFFSLQVLHQSLKFTAAGFFVLDYTLIYSIVGAVTTYLIIIIQFDVNRSPSTV